MRRISKMSLKISKIASDDFTPTSNDSPEKDLIPRDLLPNRLVYSHPNHEPFGRIPNRERSSA